ncbi:hypothetical protein GUJ93_ZPchr0006g40669 [Zizania palustris]|uniref:Uncharacterized protein n=1 Tax=Zizania palustris TaxID=103762 RepID=A0A8J5TEG6_ZIZPA|nr:hypothetical protein GUJ93_ZPchr0006g40669 [Zizania palustris]
MFGGGLFPWPRHRLHRARERRRYVETVPRGLRVVLQPSQPPAAAVLAIGNIGGSMWRLPAAAALRREIMPVIARRRRRCGLPRKMAVVAVRLVRAFLYVASNASAGVSAL